MVRRAAQALTDAGYVVEEAGPPRYEDAIGCWARLILGDFGSVLVKFGADQTAHAPQAGRLMDYLEQRAPDMADKCGITPFPDSTGAHRAVNHGYKGFLVGNTPMPEESVKVGVGISARRACPVAVGVTNGPPVGQLE